MLLCTLLVVSLGRGLYTCCISLTKAPQALKGVPEEGSNHTRQPLLGWAGLGKE